MGRVRRIRGWKGSTLIDIENVNRIRCLWYIDEGSRIMTGKIGTQELI